jgi:hypothetical protein
VAVNGTPCRALATLVAAGPHSTVVAGAVRRAVVVRSLPTVHSAAVAHLAVEAAHHMAAAGHPAAEAGHNAVAVAAIKISGTKG